MLHKTRGIVFKVTDYSESSIVVQIFTEKFGLQSYLINGAKKPKAKIRLNMLQPLSLLDMVVYFNPSGNMQRVAELRNNPGFVSIPYDVVKSSLTFFLNEVMYKSVKEHFGDEPLFNFIFSSLEFLDKAEKGLTSFHLSFLIHLSRYLGFYPDRTDELKSVFFDLVDGCFTNKLPGHAFVIRDEQLKFFIELLKSRYDHLVDLKIPAQHRRLLLENILKYYELHLESFGKVKSHLILEEVLS